jgi:hypothetical protein
MHFKFFVYSVPVHCLVESDYRENSIHLEPLDFVLQTVK